MEAAARAKMQLVLTEIPMLEDIGGGDGEDTGEEEDGGQGRDLWSEQIPLLNGSVRFGGQRRVWAGRTVEARRVAGRWFAFGECE